LSLYVVRMAAPTQAVCGLGDRPHPRQPRRPVCRPSPRSVLTVIHEPPQFVPFPGTHLKWSHSHILVHRGKPRSLCIGTFVRPFHKGRQHEGTRLK
jgi:hypothetical protein